MSAFGKGAGFRRYRGARWTQLSLQVYITVMMSLLPSAQPSQPPTARSRGPRLLFFTGGTALAETASELTAYTRNSVHLVTPFDSGGSSAALRQTFAMPAVGDIRFRIMALADKTLEAHAPVHRLFAHRLNAQGSQKELCGEVVRLVRGTHPLVKKIPDPMNGIIREHLAWFVLYMPADFPLAGASLGNLIIAAGYLRHGRRLNPTIALFSRMVRARGTVRPIVEDTAHLAVRLGNGRLVIGQHLFTGKGGHHVEAPIEKMWLTPSLDSAEVLNVRLPERTARLIRGADALCYPMGSFYSSVLANLLPQGVGRAVAACPGPKIFIPNLGHDPELLGHDVRLQVERLVATLRADAPEAAPGDMLTHVLFDSANGNYPGGIPVRWLQEQGIVPVDRPLVLPEKSALAHPPLLARELMRLTPAAHPA